MASSDSRDATGDTKRHVIRSGACPERPKRQRSNTKSRHLAEGCKPRTSRPQFRILVSSFWILICPSPRSSLRAHRSSLSLATRSLVLSISRSLSFPLLPCPFSDLLVFSPCSGKLCHEHERPRTRKDGQESGESQEPCRFLGSEDEPRLLALAEFSRADRRGRASAEDARWKFSKTSEICSHYSTPAKLSMSWSGHMPWLSTVLRGLPATWTSWSSRESGTPDASSPRLPNSVSPHSA